MVKQVLRGLAAVDPVGDSLSPPILLLFASGTAIPTNTFEAQHSIPSPYEGGFSPSSFGFSVSPLCSSASSAPWAPWAPSAP